MHVTSQLYLIYYGKDIQGVSIQNGRKKESKLHIRGGGVFFCCHNLHTTSLSENDFNYSQLLCGVKGENAFIHSSESVTHSDLT